MKAIRLTFAGLLILSLLLLASVVATAREIEGLVVYFDFDEGKGDTATDGSGTGNNGKLDGDVEWGEGKYGGGLIFGGGDGVVVVEDNDSLQFTDGLTLAAWIKPALEGDEWQLIGSKGNDANEFFELLLSPQGFLWMGWMFQNAGRIVPDQSPNNVKPDVWQHVAVTWNPDFWIVYLDGEILIEYPKQKDKLVPNSEPLILGTEINMKRYYKGVMDDWALFSKGLSQDEIKQIMGGINNLLPVEETGSKITSAWGNIKLTD